MKEQKMLDILIKAINYSPVHLTEEWMRPLNNEIDTQKTQQIQKKEKEIKTSKNWLNTFSEIQTNH